MSESLGLDQTAGSTKWNLIQLGFISFYTTGIHGTISLPFYMYKYQKLFLVSYFILLILICIPICYVQIKLGAVYRRGIFGIFSHLIPILKGVAAALLVMTYIRCLMNGVELSFSGLRFFYIIDDVIAGKTWMWFVSLCLLLTWSVIFLLSFKGMSVLGKISYVLSPLCVVLILVVLVYGYIQDLMNRPEFKHYKITNITGYNHSEGQISIIEEDEPALDIDNLSSLQSPEPWIDALLLHMNSVGLWSGILPTIGTQLYNKKLHINAGLSTLLLTYGGLNVLTVIAFTPFFKLDDYTGWAAAAKGAKPGLFFLVQCTYTRLNEAPLIAFCFYMVLFLLGILHVVLHLIMLGDTLLLSIPAILKYVKRREFLVAIICCISFMISILFVTPLGVASYLIINSYVDRLIFTLMIISMVPFITGYIKQEYQYLPVERAFMSFWYGLASLIPAAMLIYYFAVYVYPEPIVGYDERWAENLGWVLASAPIVLGVVIGAVHAIYAEEGSLKQKFIQALKTDSLRTTDSANEYDTSETYHTGIHSQRSPSESNHVTEKTEKTETEIVIKPPEEGAVAKV